MTKKKNCCICKKEFSEDDVFPIALIRKSLLETIRQEHPNCSSKDSICSSDLKEFRSKHIERLLSEHYGALSEMDKDVVESLKKQDIVTQNINKIYAKKLSFGERISDRVARFGGSWFFIFSFGFVLIFWMILNAFLLRTNAFDPYPFILLNLVLSCLAAVQAPFILMSQNRQAKRDKMQGDDEYRTNLKAELEVRQLHSKLDLFVKKQWEVLLEIQKIQIDLAEEMISHSKEHHKHQ